MLLVFPGENAARDTLRFAEETVHYGLWQADFATGDMHCSSNTYRLLGMAVRRETDSDRGEPLSFSTFEKVAHPDDMPVLAEIQHVLAEGLPFDRQFRVIHPNGRVRNISIHGEVLVGRDGQPNRIIGVLIDVTQHAENVHLSQINSDRIRTMLSAIGGTIWTARSDGYCTGLLLRDPQQGAVPHDLLGHNWKKQIHPNDLAGLERAWAHAADTKTVLLTDYRVRDESDQYRWRRNYAVPVVNEDGSIREWIGLSVFLNQASGESAPLTGAQIRAARGILNWSVRNLASRTGLSTGVVRRIEENDGHSQNAAESLLLIKDALSAGGVDFFTLPTGEAGVYPVRKQDRIKIVRDVPGSKKYSA